MAATSARDRQPIPVIAEDVAPGSSLDEVTAIIAILDAALAAYRTLKPLRLALGGYTSGDRLVAFFAKNHPSAEYALTLWASANQLDIKRRTSEYEDGTQIRALYVIADGETLVTLQWPTEPKPVSPAEVVAALRDWRPHDPHWTDDKTLTADDRAEREQMEAGHA